MSLFYEQNALNYCDGFFIAKRIMELNFFKYFKKII